MSNNKDIIKPRRGLPRTNKIILPDCRTWLSLSNFIATMSSDYSMMQLKIIILIIERMQSDISKAINHQELDLFGGQNKNSITVDIDYKSLGIESNKYGYVRKLATQMVSTPVTFDVENPETGERGWLCTGFISSVYIPSKYSRSFSVEIRKEVVDILLKVDKGFTQFIKEIAFNASSKYTIKMYLLISSWRTKGGFSIDMGKFRKWLLLEDKYKDYKDLYKRVIRPVYEELFEHSNCWFEVAEVYRPTDSQPYKLNFKVVRQPLSQKDKEMLELKKKNIATMCERHLGMSRKQIDDILSIVDLSNVDRATNKIVDLGQYLQKHIGDINDVSEYCYKSLKREIDVCGIIGESL